MSENINNEFDFSMLSNIEFKETKQVSKGKKKNNFIVKILKSIINFYNTWYGVINVILAFWLLGYVNNTLLSLLVIGFSVVDAYTWYKNIFKNLGTKKELFGTIRENNAFCVYGGVGSGKSTLAEFILSSFIPKNKRYYNTKVDGMKAFTSEHLLLQKGLEEGFGALVDESGAQVDAYHYDKKDNDTRKRIDYLNKFVRQWYSSKCMLIYIDQAQGNQNTSIHKNIYYVIQCKGVEIRPSAFLPNLIFKVFLYFINRKREEGKKINNPFSNVCIKYMEFVKLGDYADHYNVEIQDKDHKCLCGSIYTFFGTLNTYVFKKYNPAPLDDDPYIWGTSEEMDDKIMNANFNFESVQEELKNTFVATVNKDKKD